MNLGDEAAPPRRNIPIRFLLGGVSKNSYTIKIEIITRNDNTPKKKKKNNNNNCRIKKHNTLNNNNKTRVSRDDTATRIRRVHAPCSARTVYIPLTPVTQDKDP